MLRSWISRTGNKSNHRDGTAFAIMAAIACGLVTMYNIVPDAKPYFASLWDHISTFLAGCGATVVLGLLQRYVIKRPLSWRWEIAILLSFIFRVLSSMARRTQEGYPDSSRNSSSTENDKRFNSATGELQNRRSNWHGNNWSESILVVLAHVQNLAVVNPRQLAITLGFCR